METIDIIKFSWNRIEVNRWKRNEKKTCIRSHIHHFTCVVAINVLSALHNTDDDSSIFLNILCLRLNFASLTIVFFYDCSIFLILYFLQQQNILAPPIFRSRTPFLTCFVCFYCYNFTLLQNLLSCYYYYYAVQYYVNSNFICAVSFFCLSLISIKSHSFCKWIW